MAETLPPLPGAHKDQENTKDADSNSEITIHVCDEGKNARKDFKCPRDLLLDEMRYFQDYLSKDTDKWDDVDISVHCDIKIFDWLIRYVKRKDGRQPLLDVHNVVSILISSDFLKMDQLAGECIQFCHEKMSSIIATPCNMNCINDGLVTRIADTFNQHKLEQIKDKKDKFKSKLFFKLIVRLFDNDYTDVYSPSNASKLYRCLHCDKLLLPSVQNQIKCTNARTSITSRGNLSYDHERDSCWDVTEFLVTMKKQMKTWRGVYWRLWSQINFLRCDECETVFPACDLRSCLYHPQSPITKVDPVKEKELKTYPCCNQDIACFESIRTKTGCSYRDHKIVFNDQTTVNQNSDFKFDRLLNSPEVYNELLRVLDIVSSSEPTAYQLRCEYYDIRDMLKLDSKSDVKVEKTNSSVKESEKKERKRTLNAKKRPISSKPKAKVVEFSRNEEDQERNEQGIVRVVIQQKDPIVKNSKRTWNPELPSRLNQDMQRESDLKRMNDLLRNLKINSKMSIEAEPYEGGIFHRIESKLKAELSNTHVSNSSSNPTSNRKGKNTDK